jgi:hypothetical protein
VAEGVERSFCACCDRMASAREPPTTNVGTARLGFLGAWRFHDENPRKPLLVFLGFPLDSLVQIERYQRVTLDKRRNNFLDGLWPTEGSRD